MENVDFYSQARDYSTRRSLRWYHQNLMRVLEHAKEKNTRDIDKSIKMASKLIKVLDEKIEEARPVPAHDVVPAEDCQLMKPVEPAVADVLMKSVSKGATECYFKLRYKLSPEEKFNFRAVSSWDYGWRQAECRVPPRDVHRGRCRLVRDTFYRENNLARDPDHYNAPAGASVAVCGQD